MKLAFEDISMPISGRTHKPRAYGVTMVLDKGLGISSTTELVEIAGEYIDVFKLSFGTSRVCPSSIIERKIRILKDNQIGVMPGGTLLEIAIAQDKLDKYLSKAKSLGFDYIEVSDGTIPISPHERENAIKMAIEYGFRVIAEVGRKFKELDLPPEQTVDAIRRDLEQGVELVIVEAREAGRDVGIYDEYGRIRSEKFDYIVNTVDAKKLMFEAPEKHQQVELIKRLGCNVNLGNIPPTEVIALEALRNGLRADTLLGIYRKW